MLYPVFSNEDFYILSNVTPHYLMSGQSDGAYLFLDLSGEDAEIRDEIRAMISYLLSDKTCAIRADYLTSLIEKYNDGNPPKAVSGINTDDENIQIFLSDTTIRIDDDKLRELVRDSDIKDSRKRYIVKLAWDIDEGFFYTPLAILRDFYKDLLACQRIDENLFGIVESGESRVEVNLHGHVYHIKPTIGVDTLNLSKIKNVRVDSYVTKPLSNRALLMGHFASIGEPGRLLSAMIIRPDALLFPKRNH